MFLLPSAVKLTHIFTHDSHEICAGYSDAHYHKDDVDCKFYKFKLSNLAYLQIHNHESDSTLISSKALDSHVDLMLSHQHLVQYLRGPPELV